MGLASKELTKFRWISGYGSKKSWRYIVRLLPSVTKSLSRETLSPTWAVTIGWKLNRRVLRLWLMLNLLRSVSDVLSCDGGVVRCMESWNVTGKSAWHQTVWLTMWWFMSSVISFTTITLRLLGVKLLVLCQTMRGVVDGGCGRVGMLEDVTALLICYVWMLKKKVFFIIG